MLTAKRIRDAKPEPKARILWDGQVKGLGVRITPRGAKSFVLNYRAGGRERRATLARCSEISLLAARERAGRELAAIRAGESDPLERRREAKEARTVNDGMDRFFRYCDERIATGRLTQRTATEYRQQADRVIRPAIGRKAIADVTRQDIERMVAPAPAVTRNRLLALASKVFAMFEAWELRPQRTNPARGIERAREEPRDRILQPSELATLGAALDELADRYPQVVAAIRMAAVTGLRISEVLAIRWEDVNPEAGVLVIPTSKTGRRTQPLSSAALDVVAGQPRINRFVFTSGHRDAGCSYEHTREVFLKAARAAGLADVRLHDLRRTVMTSAAASGIGVHVLRDLLGHKTTQMADRYIRRTGGALVDATEQSGVAMAAMLGGEKRGEVVGLFQR